MLKDTYMTGFYNVVDNRITTAWSEALKGQVYTNISNIRISGAEADASSDDGRH